MREGLVNEPALGRIPGLREESKRQARVQFRAGGGQRHGSVAFPVACFAPLVLQTIPKKCTPPALGFPSPPQPSPTRSLRAGEEPRMSPRLWIKNGSEPWQNDPPGPL